MYTLILSAALGVSSPQCDQMGEMAHAVMNVRQVGVSEADARRVANSHGSIRRESNLLVDLAYARPIEELSSRKSAAAYKFATDVRRACEGR